MNLHSLSAGGARWIWVQVTGGNGRTWGTHAYELARGDVPTQEPGWDTPPAWMQNFRWWTPPYFAWSPYNDLASIFRRGFVAPICGGRSRARFPSAQDPWQHSRCPDCRRVATERGIMISTRQDLIRDDPDYRRIQGEYRAWLNARNR